MKLINSVVFILFTLLSLQLQAETTRGEGKIENANPRQSHGPSRDVQPMNICNHEFGMVGIEKPGEYLKGKETCEMTINPDFGKIVQEVFPRCAKQVALSLRMNIPTKVTAFQMGAYNVRKINTPDGKGDSWSRHSTGTAIDIEYLALDFGNGNPPTMMKLTEKSNNDEFYRGFRDCWKDSTKKDQNGKSCTCSIGAPHTDPPSNEVHKDHVHFSVNCPSQPKVAGC